VRLWAEEHGIRFHVRTFDTREYASDHGISIEMAARELRYRWFAELCAAEGYDEVAVAHNANDNAETLMLNLLRGSGIKGLTGMSPVSDIPYSEGASAKLIRPLLDMTRKQIEGFALANRISYRNDSTNFSSEYKRNMLRNEVFPIFERINPSFIRTLNREMGYLSEAEEIVSDYCQKEIAAISADALSRHPEERSDVRISYEDLLSRKHWRYLLYHILEPYGFNSSTLASLENLLSSDRTISGKRFEADDYVVLTERDGFRIARKIAGPAGNDIMPVRGAGTYHFNGMAFKVEVLDWTADMPLKQPEGTLVFDAGRLKFPFVLRGWREGDWLVPLGMRGKKKVSDLFADLKYDSLMKASAVMIADVQAEGMAESGHIAGVAGVRIDDRYKVRPSTHSAVRITILR
jgi:tRNA(Ile)-lysidine synthase